MKLDLRIVFVDGTEKLIVAGLPDFVAFESKFEKSMAVFAQGNVHATWLLFVAWNAFRRAGEQAAFDDWLLTVADIGVAESDPK